MASDEEIENITADILIDLLKRHKIGNTHHTAIDNIPKGFPPRQRKLVKQVVKILISDDIITKHPTGHSGIMVSINPDKISYIINLRRIKETMRNDPFILLNYKKYLDD